MLNARKTREIYENNRNIRKSVPIGSAGQDDTLKGNYALVE